MKKVIEVAKLVLAGLALFIVSFLLLNSLGCQDSILGSGEKEYTEEFTRTLDVEGIEVLDARTENGAIDVRGVAAREVEVEVRKVVRAPTLREAEDFAGKVVVGMRRSGNEILISKEHPQPPRDVEVEVSYDIRCPGYLSVDLETVNGSLRVREIAGMVGGGTTNGNIELRAEVGPFFLSTINGDIEAELGNVSREGVFTTTNGSIGVEIQRGSAPLTATTTNGSIDVELPADFSGRLDASTTHGRVGSDFEVELDGGDPPTRLSGTLGGGGNSRVRLRTTNGSIQVESR